MHVGYRKTSWTCETCGRSAKCKPCEETERLEYNKKKREYQRKKSAANVAAGLTTKGTKPQSGGWTSFRELDKPYEAGIPDKECFEAPTRITKRELEFLI